ncbi:hypothetical protein [Arenimonas metalli]|uniref:hypothetical protein n=1 Tax=Arenimonas metalli TaxID=948077 RepID=UPI0012EB6BD6|nr:hypothetical protein [Arenimonas metalli]
MTNLETALFAWTALNVAIGLWLLFTEKLQTIGSGFWALLPLAIGLPVAGFLLWRLLQPSRGILLFGALFWALQIISVSFSDALFKFRLGLSVDFRLTDSPTYVVAINLLAVVLTILFSVAAGKRLKTGAATAAS